MVNLKKKIHKLNQDLEITSPIVLRNEILILMTFDKNFNLQKIKFIEHTEHIFLFFSMSRKN